MITNKPKIRGGTLTFILVEDYLGPDLMTRECYPRTRENEKIIKSFVADVDRSSNPHRHMRLAFLTTTQVENHVPRSSDDTSE